LDEKPNSRLLVAEQFFDLATGASESAMRNSISRLYYASYHVAVALTDGKSHGDIAKRLTAIHGEVGQRFGKLHELRNKMDYRPDFFEKELRGQDPRNWYLEQMDDGVGLYYQLRGLWNRTHQGKS
jgi:uncharacterized protein (UPF0332 family)